jgi:hypothetical protein
VSVRGSGEGERRETRGFESQLIHSFEFFGFFVGRVDGWLYNIKKFILF